MQKTWCSLLLAFGVLTLSSSGHVSTVHAEPRLSPQERYIDLDGPINFRDLGGITTQDGRTVRSGLLFRSDKLSELSDTDSERLADLGIKLIIDFRSPREQEQEPDNLSALPDARYQHLPLYEGDVPVSLFQRIIAMLSVDDLSTVLVESNQNLIRNSTDEYRAWFALLLNDESTPMVFHCSGGKDRTGLATALLLTVLGVSRKHIFEDYLATNEFTKEHVDDTLGTISFYTLGLISADDVRPIMIVDRKYLMAAFDEIDKVYGDMETYLATGLGLTADKQAMLKARYLSPLTPSP